MERPATVNIIKSDNSKPLLTSEFFGKDIAGFIKQSYFKQVDVLEFIGFKVLKKTFEFYFPTIQNNLRQIQQIQTIYTDINNLNLVPCYMQRNVNTIKVHNQAKEAFVQKIKIYDWNNDKQRLKVIRDTTINIPKNIKYFQLDFVEIKKYISKCQKLKKKYTQQQNYKLAEQIKIIQTAILKNLQAYLQQPINNISSIELIQKNINLLKQIK